MYKIVIAEDEAEVRKLMAKCIDEAENEYEVVGEAGDGQEVIEQIERWQPDILVTDICMPRLNGLELIRKIREVSPGIETVIVSGYDEFRYVKEAMGMGVRDYFLKPFSPVELFDILDKISKEQEHKKALVQNMENMHQQIERDRKYSRERLLRRLLKDNGSVTNQEMLDAGFALDGKWYCCCVIHFFGENSHEKRLDFGGMMQKFLGIVEENYFASAIRLHSLEDGNHKLLLVLSCRESSLKEAEEDIRAGIEKIGSSMERYYGIRMRCTRGSLFSDFAKLSLSYQEALKIWKKVLDPEQILVEYDNRKQQRISATCVDEHKRNLEIEEAQKNLVLAVQMARKEEALSELDRIFQYYAEMPLERSQVLNMSFVRLFTLISDLKGSDDDGEIIRFLENDLKNGSLLEAKQVLEQYIGRICRTFQEENKKQGDKIIDSAEAFIESNLGNEDLNLELVAEALHFSPSYIRQLFKNVREESFSDYLFRKRMEKAVILLSNPVCKIQEIAEKTGYSNQRYFARCFRKYYGCTPTDYRNMNGTEQKE